MGSIYLRFIKLQDTLGAVTYAALLDYLRESSSSMPMFDKLNRLNQLGFLSSSEDWHLLRVLRNQFSHDYPKDYSLKASYLNQSRGSKFVKRCHDKYRIIFNK